MSLRSESGFTLVELLVAMAMSLIVLGATVSTFVAFIGESPHIDRQVQAQDAARTAIDRMAVSLRSATSTGETGNQPIQSSSSYDLVYLAPVSSASLTNNPRGLRYVRYCVDYTNPGDEQLWSQTAPYDSSTQPAPPATGSCPSSSWPQRDVIAGNLLNQLQAKALFTTVTDGSGAINNVGVRAVVDRDPNKSPPATELRSSIAVRNLNRAPTASMTCSAQGNLRVLCDASASSDPDGGPLSFAWSVSPAPSSGQPPETSYRLDQGGLTSGASYTFAMTAADAGGLSSRVTRSVTMP